MDETNEGHLLLCDQALSRRLEKAEAVGSVDFVNARAKLYPESGAEWIKVAGTYALYDGQQSPITQTFCLGLFQSVTNEEMDAIERFFQERGASVMHEVSPLADGMLALLNERGYRPIELTSILFRPVSADLRLHERHNERLRVRIVAEDEHELWARTATAGWSETTELAEVMPELTRVGLKREGGASFLAELDHQAIATGSLSMCDGVAVLAGASTIPEGRHQGAQLALLGARLRHAATAHACDIAMMGALPGSASQRNAERQGFRIAYTRIKWRLG